MYLPDNNTANKAIPHGLVLASNLIMLLLVTLIATALFKNGLNQSQMNNHYQLQLLSQNLSHQVTAQAKSYIQSLLDNNVDLTVPDIGFYPEHSALYLTDINWQDNNAVLIATSMTAGKGQYVVLYLGITSKLSQPLIGSEHHLFKLLLHTETAKGGEYQSQQFLTFLVN
ncbi:hypothetical protein [Thalassotalea sp. ND16A]|uniref:hypothetical protein n=1 Tax=Thalassotalea sp. ND16A TaxID=1535422 RepID=UPI00051A445A|nr:hypothetical protein [Thalassotalea sp. ND16A]KGJ88260.1 hypothetical protein ND16A_0200 [Thalassotalea sp. ND16A]